MNNSVKMLSPFVLYCQKVIPLAFDESMSYYECLCALYSYLKDTVVPAVNNNAEALEEVQQKMIELQEYVDNYFENLDVQEEINNKLDDMAESGQLTDIIAQYLGLAGVLAYNTIADLSDALNIAEGSICYTLGATTYNDEDGAFYKVRQITVYDTVDGYNIVALDVSDTLIAERLGTKFALKSDLDDLLPKSYGKADHLGVGNETYTSPSAWTSTVASVRANRTSTQPESLISSPSVFSPHDSEEASLYRGRDSVALFIANQGADPILSVEDDAGIDYTETYVTYPEDADISKVKVGMVIDTLHANQLSGIITSIDEDNHRFYIDDGWYYNGVKNANPDDGKGYKVGKIVKIWGSNTVVSLLPQFEQTLAVGEEMGLNNMLADVTPKSIIGYDVVTLGTGKGDIGYLARTGGAVFDSPGDVGKLEHGFIARGCTEGFTAETDTDANFLLVSKDASGNLTKNRFYIAVDGKMTNPKNPTANIGANGQVPNPEVKYWVFIPNSAINYTLPDLTQAEFASYNDREFVFLNRSAYTVTLSNGFVLQPYASVTYYAKNVWLKIATS